MCEMSWLLGCGYEWVEVGVDAHQPFETLRGYDWFFPTCAGGDVLLLLKPEAFIIHNFQ